VKIKRKIPATTNTVARIHTTPRYGVSPQSSVLFSRHAKNEIAVYIAAKNKN
jgi:hypothetical protein